MIKFRVLDLFSGIGSFSLGLERTGGFQTAAFCEIDRYASRVLARHWPEVPNIGDVTTAKFPEADVVVGGFPCQDVSRAGKRAGLSGSRSGLYRELVRAIRLVRPRYAIVENVAALLGDGLGTVLGDMAESGFDAEWDCVPAATFGAPHERDRVFVVAHAADSHGIDRRRGAGWEDGAETGDGSEPRAASDATHPDRPRQSQQAISRNPVGMGDRGSTEELGWPSAYPQSIGCRPGRAWRPPDSFARIRNEARRNAADPYGARLALREGVGRDAWEERQAAQRDAGEDGGQSIWPSEPALLGVDDDVPHRVDRVRVLGNTILPIIPEMIGHAILAAEGEATHAA